MSKLNKEKVIYSAFFSLSLLAILVFGAILLPTNASAQQYGGYVDSRGGGNQNNNQNQTYYQPVYIETIQTQTVTPIPTIFSDSTNPNRTVATATRRVTPTIATATSATTEDSSLVANAIFGTDGFMPSGLIAWILLAILILLIIIFVRRISGADKTYQATPMKHD